MALRGIEMKRIGIVAIRTEMEKRSYEKELRGGERERKDEKRKRYVRCRTEKEKKGEETMWNEMEK